jgi:uncharacterized protein (DUF58 family)
MPSFPGSASLRDYWRRIAERWLARRVPPEAPRIQLHPRRLFILPTPFGYTFAVMLAVLLLGSLNYSTSLGFAATFLLAGSGLFGMLHTYRNLDGMTLVFGHGAPVFAGSTAYLPVAIEAGACRRWGVSLTGGRRDCTGLAPQPGAPASDAIAFDTRRRGRLQAPRLAVVSTWPFGLFRVWSWVWPQVTALVYPAPVDHGYPLPLGSGSGQQGRHRALGDEDFAGLRPYRPGDPPRRIAWKTLARTDELHVKAFEVDPPGQTWLDWHELHGLTAEARYQQVCHWVLALRYSARAFGVVLPGTRIEPSCGADHEQRCLEALALSRPA